METYPTTLLILKPPLPLQMLKQLALLCILEREDDAFLVVEPGVEGEDVGVSIDPERNTIKRGD